MKNIDDIINYTNLKTFKINYEEEINIEDIEQILDKPQSYEECINYHLSRFYNLKKFTYEDVNKIECDDKNNENSKSLKNICHIYKCILKIDDKEEFKQLFELFSNNSELCDELILLLFWIQHESEYEDKLKKLIFMVYSEYYKEKEEQFKKFRSIAIEYYKKNLDFANKYLKEKSKDDSIFLICKKDNEEYNKKYGIKNI